MIKTEFTVNTFVDFLREHISNQVFRDFVIIIDYANGAEGGCSCNRRKRIQAMNDIYSNKVANLNTAAIEEIKTIKNSKGIIFYNELGLIIKEF